VGTNGDDDTLFEYKQRTTEVETTPVTPSNGIITVNVGSDWSDEASVYIRQTYPLPATVLAIMPDVEFSNGGERD